MLYPIELWVLRKKAGQSTNRFSAPQVHFP
jgi:hypothetical protein